jgi:hypothetical protein
MLHAIARYIEHKSANELNVRALKKIENLAPWHCQACMHACGTHINSDCDLFIAKVGNL